MEIEVEIARLRSEVEIEFNAIWDELGYLQHNSIFSPSWTKSYDDHVHAWRASPDQPSKDLIEENIDREWMVRGWGDVDPSDQADQKHQPSFEASQFSPTSGLKGEVNVHSEAADEAADMKDNARDIEIHHVSDSGKVPLSSLHTGREQYKRFEGLGRATPLPGVHKADTPFQSSEIEQSRHPKPLPHAVKGFKPLPDGTRALIPTGPATRTFARGFLLEMLEGIEYSPGYYFMPKSHGDSLLDSRGYYLIEAGTDPYLPSEPGTHGAKLVPFVRTSEDIDDPSEENTHNCPVFIRVSAFAHEHGKNPNEYIYFGNYSQLRFSDRLDYDRMTNDVPQIVKTHWAEKLADMGRPAWVTSELKEHFSAPSKPRLHSGGTFSSEHLREFAHKLKRWDDQATLKVDELTPEMILKSFEFADAAEVPGLRLWWEYLECVHYDREFYDAMLNEQDSRNKG